ncbi:hypothetical protein Prudu_017272, partial [Prunus dulcis]
YKGFRREDERVLGFARESRREEAISGEKIVVVLVAEVISGESSWCYEQGEPLLSSSCTSTPFPSNREILAGYRQIAERRRRGATLLDTSPQRKSPGGTGGAWPMGTGSVLQGRALSSTFLPTSSSVKWGPISKEKEDEVEWVRAQLSDTERECGNLVTQKNLFESGLLQGREYEGGRDIDEAEMQKRLRESRAKKAEKSAGKRPRDDDEGRVADVLGKRRALEEAHQQVMGSGPRLPPFDLQAPPKLPFGMEDVFAEGVEKVDFGRLRQQKKEVNLAMHRQEVPLAFGEMYVSMAKADKEIQRLKRRDEQAKAKWRRRRRPSERRTPCWFKGCPGQGGGGAEESEG